jgi:hypothetical protein
MDTTQATIWFVYRDQNDDDGVLVRVNDAEQAALVTWFGDDRTIYMPDLAGPTFSEYADSKAAAFQSALAALERGAS